MSPAPRRRLRRDDPVSRSRRRPTRGSPRSGARPAPPLSFRRSWPSPSLSSRWAERHLRRLWLFRPPRHVGFRWSAAGAGARLPDGHRCRRIAGRDRHAGIDLGWTGGRRDVRRRSGDRLQPGLRRLPGGSADRHAALLRDRGLHPGVRLSDSAPRGRLGDGRTHLDAGRCRSVAALRARDAAQAGREGLPGRRPSGRTVPQERAGAPAVDRGGATSRAGRPAEEVFVGVDVEHRRGVVAYAPTAPGTKAVSAPGGERGEGVTVPVTAPRLQGVRGTMIRVARTIRTHLEPTSTVMQNSLRVAIGLALAVLTARLLGLSHAFWVVLGTLQVLRSTALGTGRTTVQALIGNVIGVVIGGVFAILAGNHPLVMWAALPIAIFVAAYAATAVGFAASQAAFTINLIVIFNLISPAGWQVGLVRIEDLAVGAAISVVVGVLLWPRGARRELARSVAGFYPSVIAYLDRAFERVLGFQPPTGPDPARRAMIQAAERAGEAFDAFLNERSAPSLDPQTAGFLLAAGNHAILAADLLDVISTRLGYQASGCPDGARSVRAQVRILLNGFSHLAHQLALEKADGDIDPVSQRALRAAALDCLRRWRDDESAGRGAMAAVVAGEWRPNLARLEEDLKERVAQAVHAGGTRWWR